MSNQKTDTNTEARLLAVPPPPTGSDPEADDWAYDEDYDDQFCHFCGGDGYVFGDDLDDPLWYDSHEIYQCTCCHGSGKAKDCTWW